MEGPVSLPMLLRTAKKEATKSTPWLMEKTKNPAKDVTKPNLKSFSWEDVELTFALCVRKFNTRDSFKG